jgi:hypothetical protein
MNFLKTTLIVFSGAVIFSCASKKSTTSNDTTNTNSTAKIGNGIFEPGKEQLVAIQAKHSGATMEKLKEGYGIYTGTCTNCHKAKAIYAYTEEKWPAIIDNMSKKAKLTDTQKDALTQYVFSIKATQPAPAPNK